MHYIGIDPGAAGGIAVLDQQGQVVTLSKLPPTLLGLWFTLRNLSVVYDKQVFVMLEKVGGYVGGGRVCPVCHQPANRSPGSAMFNFGQNFGHIEALLVAADLPHKLIPTTCWQRGVGLTTKPKDVPQPRWKSVMAQYARELHPGVKIILNTADALLIATHCWREKSASH